MLAMVLFEIVLVFGEIENIIFTLGKSRLELDAQLVDQRIRFGKEKEAVRQYIIKAYKVQPPSTP